MFGPWLSQLGLIITALVHMKKYARIPYSFVCRPSLPWTKLDHHRLPMAEVRTQHCARETTEPIIFSEAQNGIKLLFHMPHFFARGYCLLFLALSLSLSLSLSLCLKVCYFCPIKTNTSRKTYKIAL